MLSVVGFSLGSPPLTELCPADLQHPEKINNELRHGSYAIPTLEMCSQSLVGFKTRFKCALSNKEQQSAPPPLELFNNPTQDTLGNILKNLLGIEISLVNEH